MFGLENATITKIYNSSNQTRNIYGSIILQNPLLVSLRCWIEENSGENRKIDGDSFNRYASLYTNKIEANEGDLLEIVPDSILEMTTRKWRIEKKQNFFSSVGVYRSDLDLVEEIN